MYVNLHNLPRGQHMYTVGLTADPVGTPPGEVCIEEVDVVAPAGADVDTVIARADLAGLVPECRIVGVIDQSDGYIMWSDPDSTRGVSS